MAFSLKGIKVPHRKNTAGAPAERMVTDGYVTLSTAMHIGKPSIPVVKAGDSVKVGSLVAEAAEGLSSPVYSSVSGKVSGINDILASNGSKVTAIVIDSDGEMNVDENIAPQLRQAVLLALAVQAFPLMRSLQPIRK